MLTTFDQTRKSTAINSCTRRARIIFTAWCTSRGCFRIKMCYWRDVSFPRTSLSDVLRDGERRSGRDEWFCWHQMQVSNKSKLETKLLWLWILCQKIRKSDFHDVSIFHADGDVIPTEVTRIFPKGSFPSVPIWFSWLQIASEIELASLWGIIHKCHHACIQLFTSTYIYLSIFPI